MDSKEEVFRLLKEHKAEFIRQRRHRIYRLPNGRIFVTGVTQTDERGWRNRLAQLRKLLGVVPPDNGAGPSRRRLKASSIKTGLPQPVLFLSQTLPQQSFREQLKTALAKTFTVGIKDADCERGSSDD